jgi:hypothetical protein
MPNVGLQLGGARKGTSNSQLAYRSADDLQFGCLRRCGRGPSLVGLIGAGLAHVA